MSVGTPSRGSFDLLQEELERAVVLETQLHELVARQLEHEEMQLHPAALDWLHRLEPRVHAHRAALEAALGRLAARPSRLRRALGGALDSLAGWTSRAREAPAPELTRDVRDAYALLSATIASYVIVAITADVVGDAQAVGLAQAHGDDANAFLEELAGLLASLTREALLDPPATPQAVGDRS